MSLTDIWIAELDQYRFSVRPQALTSRVDTAIAALQELETAAGFVPQVANTFFAGPTAGGPLNPSFRALFDTDFPSTLNISIATIGLGTPANLANILDIADNRNTNTGIHILNNNAGNAASSRIQLDNGTSNDSIANFGAGFATAGLTRADGLRIAAAGAGGLTLATFSAQPIYFGTSAVEVARFDATGNLGIGDTAPAVMLSLKKGNSWPGINIINNALGTYQFQPNNATNSFELNLNGAVLWSQDSGGHFRVGPAAPSSTGIIIANVNGAANNGMAVTDTNAAAGTDGAVVFDRAGARVGSITTTLTATAYNTSSDQNLKTIDEGRVVDTGALVDGVSPHAFHWDSTKQEDYGFFAQELFAAVGSEIPGAVHVGSANDKFGSDDYEVWGVDLGRLVPVLWQEVRSLRARVLELEGGAPPAAPRRARGK